MPRRGSGVEILSHDLAQLIKDTRAVDRKLALQFRRELRGLAEPLRRAVAAEASWSRRIPGATKVATRFTARSQSISVQVDKRKAPHARPLEQGSQGNRSTVRHPLFGNRDVWVSQPTRPFFAKAVMSQDYRIDAAVNAAAARLERQLGFK